jgi:hypothetical protein
MSQAGKVINTGGVFPPPGPILTLTAENGTVVSPTVGGTINIVGPATQIGAGTTTGTANTITINPWIFATANTVDGVTVVPLYTLAIAVNTAVTVNALVNVKSSTFARAGAGAVRVGVLNNGGVLSIIGVVNSSLLVEPNGNLAQLNAAISGSNLVITVVGEAGVNYTWNALIYYVTN